VRVSWVYPAECTPWPLDSSVVTASQLAQLVSAAQGGGLPAPKAQQGSEKKDSCSAPRPLAAPPDRPVVGPAPAPAPAANRPVRASHTQGQIPSPATQAPLLPSGPSGRDPRLDAALTTLPLHRLNVACLKQLQASQATGNSQVTSRC